MEWPRVHEVGILSAGGRTEADAKFDTPGYAEKIKGNPQTAQHKKDFVVAQKNLKLLFDAGVKVVFGTDSGTWPGRIPGFAEHREFELMG
jgi:imidazolonepropionase-like amidohydrolase